jgi:DUF971 family protein
MGSIVFWVKFCNFTRRPQLHANPSVLSADRLHAGPSDARIAGVKPEDISQIGDEVAIRWKDGGETFIRMETLRRFCPCAACMGEKDIMGNVYRPAQKPLEEASFHLVELSQVGAYGLQPRWADGHGTGIFSWEYLRRLGDADAAGPGPEAPPAA